MNRTMQAAQVETFGSPLVLRDIEIPTPGPGRILVRTEACGVCHTDLHAAKGDWPVKPQLPFTPGHEGIGRVVALGAGVTAVKEGDRVGVPWLFSACGHCEFCLAAHEPVCGDAQFGGYTQNGGFAEYIVADPELTPRNMLEFAGVLSGVDPSQITTYQITASPETIQGNAVLVPTLQNDNMQAILAVFRGEATLGNAPDQVLEPAPDATSGTTTTPTSVAPTDPGSTTQESPESVPTTTTTTPLPSVQAVENDFGFVPDKNISC